MKKIYSDWLWPLINWLLFFSALVFAADFGVFSFWVLAAVVLSGVHLCLGELFEIDGDGVKKKDVIRHAVLFALLAGGIGVGILATGD